MSEPQQSNETNSPQPNGKKSGFEHADTALNAAGKVANFTGSAIVMLYGLALLVAGIAVIVIAPEAWWAGGLVALYGGYLIWPGGNKFVIY